MTLFIFARLKESSFYFGSNVVNFCENFMKIIFKELYLIVCIYVLLN